MKRAMIGVLMVLALAAAGVAAGATRAAGATAGATRAPRFTKGDGLRILSSHQLDSRLVALRVSSVALGSAANVRILLPAGYAQHPRRRYPVLYLLHGTSGGAADWTRLGAAEQTTAGRPLMVVMPDIALGDDGGGWCTNWFGSGASGRPQWETFHIGELIPWIDQNLRTVRSRGGRAIAGLSQGGFCSMSYAARHPDLFGTALSFSGAPDIAYDTAAQGLVTPIINATELALDGVPANSMFGPRVTEEINWAAHDPTTLAGNLRDTKLLLYTGNGQPGPLDSGAPNAGAMAIEAGVQQLTQFFHSRLQSLHIPSFLDDYGPGTHSWPYWARDLRQSIGPVMAAFTHPAPAPARVSYTSAAPSYSVYGWRVAMRRQVAEFSTIVGAGIDGFTLQGSGSATVSTPRRYRPGTRYRIQISSPSGTSATLERVNPRGELELSVPLGPSDTVQEFPLDGPPLGTTVYTTRVAITPAGR